MMIFLFWIIGAIVSYKKVFSKWVDSHGMFERIMFAVLWPCVLGLYILTYLYGKLRK